MKKSIAALLLLFFTASKTEACSWYDPDYDYFNLFTQTIIKDKSYLPFLHTLSNRFYDHEHFEIPNENIESWQNYFGKKLSYSETQTLVEDLPMAELNAFKKGNSSNPILSKLGSYSQYSEAIDYLIEAKYLEPFMRIQHVENPDSFYYSAEENLKNATDLDYDKTVAALTSLYNAAKNPEIKLRYGYQLVRFNHYTHRYKESTEAFKKFVEPIKMNSAAYYLALDQFAGAQRGLKNNREANWNFFQVFMKSKSRKESAFTSMKFSDSATFDNLLKKARTSDEKNMAYFLLGYDEFSNPIPMMEKMFDIDPNSEILKVLAARSINELERSYLAVNLDYAQNRTSEPAPAAVNKTNAVQPENESFWQKIKNFFSRIFGSAQESTSEKSTNQSENDLLKNPNRIPFFTKNESLWGDQKSQDFADDFKNITSKIKQNSTDEFWQIADAYLSFLQKDYEKSSETLNKIKTMNPEYLTEINRMKMLNDISGEPKITAEFEEYLVKTYPQIFQGNFPSSGSNPYGETLHQPSTQEFIRDILANRYFLQGEDGKSFLMNNKLSDLQYNPNSKLVKSVEDFYRKTYKTTLEKKLMTQNESEVGNIEAFFNVIYGDREMRLANFGKARLFYEKATGFEGIPRLEYTWNESDTPEVKKKNYGNSYNGFDHVPTLVFGHNVWESFGSTASESMEAENFGSFAFVGQDMSKLDLVAAVLQLKVLGAGTGQNAVEANQLIGNLLYNTSILGYYRHLFVMDVDNADGQKYRFWNNDQPAFKYYYKNFTDTSFVEPDNFDLALQYYSKALDQTADREQKARILFQMASAEQGKYYQYEGKNTLDLKYDDPDYDRKQTEHLQALNQTKNQKFRTYFAELKKSYRDTKTSQSLQSSCSYYDYFLKK